jgi:hypothetical protein
MAAKNSTNNFCFALICEPGELEIKSAILAFSLNKVYHNLTKVFVLIPRHRKEQIAPSTYTIFEQLSVNCCFFDNHITSEKQNVARFDPMSNKFFGIGQLDYNGDIVFLDSDMICLDKISPEILDFPLSVKPADYGLRANWKAIYSKVEIPFPKRTSKSTVDAVEEPGYYNTGMIIINGQIKDQLCNEWELCFKFVSDEKILKQNLFNPYHCDQLAFALAVNKLNITINEIPERFNFPARSRACIANDTVFAHYHDCFTIAKIERLRTIFVDCISSYPLARDMLSREICWKLLAKKRFVQLRAMKQFLEVKKKIKRLI